MFNDNFMQACDNDKLLAREIIRIMSIEYPLYISEIDRAILANDATTIKHHLHLLKGGLAYLGFKAQTISLASLLSLPLFTTSFSCHNFALLYSPIRDFLLNLPINLAQELNSCRQD
jgi:HPt (histidine-containing phosphotransfer) domain-containing protein